MKKIRKNSGFVAFTSLIVIAAAVLTIAVSLPLLGITEASSSLGFRKNQETLKIAEGCVENALIRLRANAGYSGETLSVGNGSCIISLSGTGVNRTITVVATLIGPPDYVKNLQVTAQRVGNSVNLLTWIEN